MDTEQIRYLGDVQRLEVKPEDVFVLTLPTRVPLEVHEGLQTYWSEKVPTHKLIILEPGMTLGAIGRAAVAPAGTLPAGIAVYNQQGVADLPPDRGPFVEVSDVQRLRDRWLGLA